MKSIFIIEMAINLEASDDFCSDYTGELTAIFENLFFISLEEAWNTLMSRISRGGSDCKFKGDYMHSDGMIYKDWSGWYSDDMKIDEEHKVLSLLIDRCGGGYCDYKIRELKRG